MISINPSSKRTLSRAWLWISLLLIPFAPSLLLASESQDACLLDALHAASAQTTVAELLEACPQQSDQANIAGDSELKLSSEPVTNSSQRHQSEVLTAMGRRVVQKQSILDDPFGIAPHRPNYLLPAVYIDEPNQAPFAEVYDGQLQHTELQFQISLKATLAKGVLLGKGQLVAGYTNRSFWQAYNAEISRPFRETNHEPELILNFDSNFELFGLTNTQNSLIFNHQSNGQSGDLSRSWNRVMFQTTWEKSRFAFALRPWYRIPESDGDFLGDPRGDDNPDITNFLGDFDFHSAYSTSDHTFSLMFRKSFKSSSYGAFELGWSFPLSSELRGFVKYFNGYGESLIDYNQSTESLGIGVEMNDWL